MCEPPARGLGGRPTFVGFSVIPQKWALFTLQALSSQTRTHRRQFRGAREEREGRWPMAARHGHRLGPRDPRSRLCGRPAPRSPSDPTGHRDHGRALPHSTAPCERLVSTHARRPPMTPPGMASRGPSLLTIARLSQRPSFSRTRLLYMSFYSPRSISLAAPAMSFKLTMGMSPSRPFKPPPCAGPALVCEVLV